MQAFDALTASLSETDWLMLGVLATERRLTASTLSKVSPGDPETRARLDGWVSLGLLQDAGTMQSFSARSALGERAFAVPRGYRSRILRKLGTEGALQQIRELAKRAVGDKSLAGFLTAVHGGSIARLERALPDLRWSFPPPEAAAFARAMLLEAVCVPFDARWFEETWAEDADAVAEQVLADALFALDHVDGLYAWATARRDTAGPAGLRVLAEHAFLRGERESLSNLGGRLAAAEQLAIEAASSYLGGDRGRAERCSKEFLAWDGGGRVSASRMPSVAVLVALLQASRSLAEGEAIAKRLVRPARESDARIRGWTSAPGLAAVGRSVRLLLRHLSARRHERPRLDVHQLPPDAAAWEILLQGLAVHLQGDPPLARAAWARRLARDTERYESAGYAWFAAQTGNLARHLDEEVRPPTNGIAVSAWMTDLLQPEPEWKKSLDALAAFASDPAPAGEVPPLRIAWFVDMSAGTLSKPALEEFRSGTGWTRTRRLEVSELGDLERQLPSEDAAVLRAIQSAAPTDASLAALDALVSHPRVFNGVRGSATVEVVRGTPRVETVRQSGQLVVRVEPAGAGSSVHAVVESEQRLVVYRLNEAMTRLSRLLNGELRVPETHAKDVLPVLAKLAEQVEIRSLDLAAERLVESDPTPCIRISPEAGAFWVELGVRPFGKAGRFFPPDAGEPEVSWYDEGTLLRTRRDLDEERARVSAVIEQCPTLRVAQAEDRERGEDASWSFALGEEGLYELLGELQASGVGAALEWQNCRPIRARGKLTGKSLYGRLRRTKGWYLVSGSVRIDEVTEARLSELVAMPFTKSGKFVRLPSGDFVEVERRVRQVLAVLRATPSGGGRARSDAELRIPEAAFGALQAMEDLESGLSMDEEGKAWLAHLEAALGEEYALPDGLKATLRPYQQDGYRWLRRFSAIGMGVCLADDMGLGKTVQLIALLLARARGGPALVVAPTSVCTNWLEELARFAPGLRAVEYAGKHRRRVLAPLTRADEANDAARPDVVIVSYALLQQDEELLEEVSWHTAVLDEAQFIKNAESLRARAAFRLRADYRVALTGTPVENHLGDLWSIFHFLNEALLGTWKEFQVRFQNPIERDGDTEQRAILRNLLQPFILRRLKDDVLKELPPLTVVRHEVRLSSEEALLYGVLRRQIHDKLRTPHGRRQHKLQIFAELVRLRRFCCHPRLVFPEASADCSKLDVFIELAEELRQNGHRAIVFSQFVDYLQFVRERLDERRIEYLYLDGSTPKEDRQTRVTAFQNGQADLFLVSLKAGGFGVNLTAADYVIHLDPWWNPAVEAQATDRAHRIGQSRPVTVYRLITKDTIEESILELHHHKKAIADAMLEGSDAAAHLTVEDLRALIGPAA